MFFVLTCSVFFCVFSSLDPQTRSAQGANMLEHEGDSSDTFRSRLLSVDELHYLDVPIVETIRAFDDFDCNFRCVNNPLCFSVNLATSKDLSGKFQCQLLSSNKSSNAKDFMKSKSWHHFSIMGPCFPSPCQNGGTCQAINSGEKFECLCTNGFIGKYCDKVATSCKEVYDENKLNGSQLVTLKFAGSTPTSVRCQMGDFGCGDGGWTPVMKIDGNKMTFHYDSEYWKDTKEYNLTGGETGFDSQETKLPSYWNTPFSKICLGMKINQQINFIVINKNASSLYSLIANESYRATFLGRNTWKTLLGSRGSLQTNCDKEGFNTICGLSGDPSRARIGINGNDQNDCNTCDSRIGFGTAGHPDDSNTCGNEATASPDNGNKNIKSMGYILVQ